jgi:serine/threonine protein kinase
VPPESACARAVRSGARHSHPYPSCESTSSARRYLTSTRFLERGFIARGGMSTVIRALDGRIHREVALKLLLPELEEEDAAVARMEEEARVMAYLDHPRIPTLYDFDSDDLGLPFLSMKLLEGETLEDALSRADIRRLEASMLARFIGVFVEVCRAVAFAHSRGVIHRDLKPANVMVGSSGEAYVIDWGVAQRTRLGEAAPFDSWANMANSLVGTPCYMAPEQLAPSHEQVDERADVFGLGAILYQILTGEPPRLRTIDPGVLRLAPDAIRAPESIVRGARIPADLSRIALKALSHDRADRYPSVLHLIDDLQR